MGSHQLFAGIEKELHKPRQSGWTPLEPETPPISPPLNSLLQLTARNSSSASLSTPSTTTSTSASRTLHDRVLHQPPPLNKLFNTRTESSTACIQNQRYSSDGDNEDGSTGGLSRDEKLVSEMNIPCTVEDIIHKPMEELNDLLSRYSVSEEIINICRDIRRRGKNKIAAQNCRKRKLEQIDELQKKVDEAKRRQQMLQSDHKTLLRTYTEKVNIFTELKKTILNHHQRSSDDFEVVVDGDNVRILPKDAVPEDQRFPKSPESLRFRLSPPEDPFRNGNLNGYNLNNHQQHPYFNRVWDQNNI